MLVVYVVVIFFGVLTLYNHQTVETFSMPVSKKVILIDAGHGGWDPGSKVGGADALEKDINLAIARKLQVHLEQGGSYVLLTRAEDEALSERKSADMAARRDLANHGRADMIISIHQNSFTSERVAGTQVFYYTGSQLGKHLAESVQEAIVSFTEQPRNLGIKANDQYYILRTTTIPAILIECGFLSNPAERRLLMTEEYQEKIAWAIYKGILNFYETVGG